MPHYGVPPKYAWLIVSGQKRHIIRLHRPHNPTQPGDILSFYTGRNTQDQKELCAYEAKSVTPLVVHETHLEIDGQPIPTSEAVALLETEGFKTAEDYIEYQANTHGLPWDKLELITW